MNSISIDTVALKTALKSFKKTHAINVKDGSKKTVVVLNLQNKELLEHLQAKVKLSKDQQNKVNALINGKEGFADKEVANVQELYTALSFMNMTDDPVLSLKINNKHYPVSSTVETYPSFMGDIRLTLSFDTNLGSMNYTQSFSYGYWNFQDKGEQPKKMKVIDLLKLNDIKIPTDEEIEHIKNLNKKIPGYLAQANKVYDAVGYGLSFHQWFGWQEINLGHKTDPVQVVIETKLENQHDPYGDYEANVTAFSLPFVRIFSFKHKQYCFVDIEDLQEHVFHREDKNKIVLPEKMLNALHSIFNVGKSEVFGDVFHGRHGGIVVLANGPSGVGKTLSAEVFAEYQERPLYTMEMGEIGTSLAQVEQNLQKIFARAKKWNAVLLFDEADIFLAERTASDLERSAIVGVFLRLLDYYEGTFFLTTNRGEGIDKAFKSRVTLYLDYPELSSETREKIWKNMLSAAEIKIVDSHVSWTEISDVKLNGRQIRNQVRLLRLMYPNKELTSENLLDSLEFAAK